MKINDLYEQKNLVASNLKNCIRDNGYTKISFANKLEIDKKELEDLLSYCPKSEKEQTYGRYNEMSDVAKKQYDLLVNVVDLCSIYSSTLEIMYLCKKN